MCVCVAGAAAAGVRAEQPSAIVRVYDVTPNGPALRHAAMHVADGILAQAGVTLDWRDCSLDADRQRCRQGRGPNDLTVRVVTEFAFPGGRTNSPSESSAVATGDGLHLGFAALDAVSQRGVLATVFHDRVQGLAERLRLNYTALLGRAMAHEVGHLLLGQARHGTTGLMRAVWTDEELGRNHPSDWLFAPSDAHQMRRVTSADGQPPAPAIATF